MNDLLVENPEWGCSAGRLLAPDARVWGATIPEIRRRGRARRRRLLKIGNLAGQRGLQLGRSRITSANSQTRHVNLCHMGGFAEAIAPIPAKSAIFRNGIATGCSAP